VNPYRLIRQYSSVYRAYPRANESSACWRCASYLRRLVDRTYTAAWEFANSVTSCSSAAEMPHCGSFFRTGRLMGLSLSSAMRKTLIPSFETRGPRLVLHWGISRQASQGVDRRVRRAPLRGFVRAVDPWLYGFRRNGGRPPFWPLARAAAAFAGDVTCPPLRPTSAI